MHWFGRGFQGVARLALRGTRPFSFEEEITGHGRAGDARTDGFAPWIIHLAFFDYLGINSFLYLFH